MDKAVKYIMPKENKEDNLIENLYKKCKVTNLPELYHRLLDKAGHMLPISELRGYGGYFVEDNIIKDMENVEDVIVAEIYEAAIEGIKKHRKDIGEAEKIDLYRKKKRKGIPKKIKCLLDTEGLCMILSLYRKMNIFNKSEQIPDITKKLGIREKDTSKLLRMLGPPTSDGRAGIIIDDDGKSIKLIFVGKFLHPANRGLLLQLILTAGLGLTAFIILYITVFGIIGRK